MVFLITIKSADLVNQSTITYKAINPIMTFDNPPIKSIKMCSHFYCGILRGYNSLNKL